MINKQTFKNLHENDCNNYYNDDDTDDDSQY